MPIQNSKRLSLVKTELPPCCVRICPSDNSVIILGTYMLEKDRTRHGSIDVYEYDEKNGNKLTISNQYKVDGAVLDLKFHSKNDSILISAHSTGNLIFWKVDAANRTLSELKNYQLFDEETLITSIFCSPINQNLLLATATTGEAALVNILDYSVQLLDTVHDLECWTGSFGEIGELSQVVFTGGDDAKLIAHDLRTNQSIWNTGYRHHGAGVVSILSPGSNWNTNNSSHLWTGSYDDSLRILDLRVIDKGNPLLIPGYIPKVIQEENLGGGVWRLIPSPLPNDNRVMSCCMYDGARIIEPDNDTFEVARYFKGDHESMCYGGDWSSSGKFIATSSFYDNIVQIWSPDETE
ncbi:unnamed protein product [Debaryomyces tyrocola]|nr:unnamed protein product [Debaryomyces tyrocola]